jgi:hypothetical protein
VLKFKYHKGIETFFKLPKVANHLLTFSLVQYGDILRYITTSVAYETEISCTEVPVFHPSVIEDTFGY